jgi:hypothetical protein
MFLTTDPSRTFKLGLADGHLEPADGDPAFEFRYMTGRDSRKCRDFAESLPAFGMTGEQAEQLYAMLRQRLVGWANVPDPNTSGATLDFTPADLDAILSDAEAKRLLWRMIRGNELQPDALKNLQSPSPTPTDSSATAAAGNAPTPPA